MTGVIVEGVHQLGEILPTSLKEVLRFVKHHFIGLCHALPASLVLEAAVGSSPPVAVEQVPSLG